MIKEDKAISTSELNHLLDLPTRVKSVKDMLQYRDPETISLDEITFRGNKYHKEEVILRPFARITEQIVIEGNVCNTDYMDKDGNSTFNIELHGSDEEAEIDPEPKPVQEPSPDDNESCPYCRFMKKGSCRTEFINWDQCVQSIKEDETLAKCHKQTYYLMKCMSKDEYYDIMSTNSHKHLPRFEAGMEEGEEAGGAASQ